jgi:hypothetical protein
MTGASAADLPEPLDIIERNRELTATYVRVIDVFTPLKWSMAYSNIEAHEAVSIEPARIVGTKPQKALPQRVDHRRSRMTGIGLLRTASIASERTVSMQSRSDAWSCSASRPDAAIDPIVADLSLAGIVRLLATFADGCTIHPAQGEVPMVSTRGRCNGSSRYRCFTASPFNN